MLGKLHLLERISYIPCLNTSMTGVQEFLFRFLCHLMLLLVVAGDGGECPASFECGYIGNISFPFTTAEHPNCGLFPIQNCYQQPWKPRMIQFQDKGKWFRVIRQPLVPARTSIHIRDTDFYELLQSRSCEAFRKSYTLPPTFQFASLSLEFNATLFRCNRSHHVGAPTYMYNYTSCPGYDLYYNPLVSEANQSSLAACTKVLLPIKDVPDATDPFTFVTADILIQVHLSQECANCHYKERGQCHLDSKSKFYCANANGCRRQGVLMKIALALGPVTLVVVLVIATLYYTRRDKQSSKDLLVDAFLERHGHLQIKRYSYSEIKKVTNCFRNKLGQGGFGSVYKGQLQDGCPVAVKLLNDLKGGDGEEFINEVSSMSRTSHVNIVTLIGFCFEGSKRALVYEFMPKGSLEKFIYEENAMTLDCQLNCQTLYDIAIGVARGLEYLHKGCNTRILHFDIKPHNILLDENLCPKISDFGLAKVCTRNESMVSIFGARGTAGYIAPEVFSRNFGAVSHKSDVYSYGMMVLEMVGRRKNIKADADASSELYFPHWIYNRLVTNQELCLRSVENESDDENLRKMTIVSLWCIQTKPSTRPSISKVVEMLEGRVESLQLPPKPFWFTPANSPNHMSCELETL